MIKSSLQSVFFSRMADPRAIRKLFEHLPGVYFFVKDRDSRMIAASPAIFERLGVRDEAEMLGKTDGEFFPPHIADGFRSDDNRIFCTGQPLIDRLEGWYDEKRNLEWCLTTKLPIHDQRGAVIGLMGITRRDEGRAAYQSNSDIALVLNMVQQHANRILSTAELAHRCGLSERTLYRKVQQALAITPYELMLRTRIQKAAEALIKTRDPIIEIAIAHGFCDQSTFTQHFRKRTGLTPRQFRIRNQA